MSYLVPSTSLQSTERCESQRCRPRPHTASIDILDDDSLLHIFYLYRPFIFGEDEDDNARLRGGSERWDRGHWWLKLSHVCQRWRKLILASPSYLGLFLACTSGTPVADMLAHSPSLPLVVDYGLKDSEMDVEEEDFEMDVEVEYFDLAAEDKQGFVLALSQRDRVCRIRLEICTLDLHRVIMALDKEYPNLEYLDIVMYSPNLILPQRLQAPHLRHLVLSGFRLPIGSRLLTTSVNLVTFVLIIDTLSIYFHPDALLHWISFMPQLETLVVLFLPDVHSRYIARKPSHMPFITPITLPNLGWFCFQGESIYLEEIVCRMSTPRLERLEIFFKEITFPIPRLLQFMTTKTRDLRFRHAQLEFSRDQVDLATYPNEDSPEGDRSQSLHIRVLNWLFFLQVTTVAQISNSLSQMFSAVEHLTLMYDTHRRSSEDYKKVDRPAWRTILRSFSNVKTLRVEDPLGGVIARCLRLEDGELPFDILPKLHELTCSRNSDTDNEIASFINARQNADRPIRLVDL